MSSDHKQIIVIRKDLNMRKGKIGAQAAHSSMKVLLDIGERHTINGQEYLCIPLTNPIKPWLDGLFKKIVVSVDSKEELLSLQEKAKAAQLLTALIEDSGLTEFNGIPTLTALAIGPDTSERLELTSHLKLL